MIRYAAIAAILVVALAAGAGLAFAFPGTPGTTAGVLEFSERPAWMNAVMAVAGLVILGWLAAVNWTRHRR